MIFYDNDNWINIKRKVEQELQEFKYRFDYSKLTLNLNKTKFITFSINRITNSQIQTFEIQTKEQSFHIPLINIYWVYS